MEPRVIAVLGIGGFMCFLFLIVGIVVWVMSEDEGGTGTGAGTGAGTGGRDGTTRTQELRCPFGQTKYKSTSDTEDKCYPICDEYGGRTRGFHWAQGSGQCGTTDSSRNAVGDALVDAAQSNDKIKCSKRFTKDQASSTGYSVCQKTHYGNRCGIEYSPGGISRIECVPKNAHGQPENSKVPICGRNTWMRGKVPSQSTGATTWEGQKQLNDSCKCPEGTNQSALHSGHENKLAKDTWRCI